MSDIIKDLEGKSLEELKQMGREKQGRLNKAEAVRDRDFSFSSPPEEKVVGPITDEDVAKLVKEAEEIIAKGHIVFLDARLRAVAEAAQKKIDAAKARMEEISLHGLPEEVQPRKRDSVRTESRSQSRRQMFVVNLPCAKCGVNVPELSFEPRPGQEIYCHPHYMEVLAQRRGGSRTTVVGDALNQRLQEDNERLKAQVETLTAAAGHGGEKMPSGLSKKKQKEWRSQHRGESEEQE